MRSLIRTVPIIFTLLSILTLAACGGGGPQERTFTIEVQGGQPVGGASTLEVNQDDEVTIEITSDTDIGAHLHGYDIEDEAVPGQTATMSFTADTTGRFPIEVHGTEVVIAYLEVQPR